MNLKVRVLFSFISKSSQSNLPNFSTWQPKINTEITTTQIALNYIVAKGGVPLPEVNSPSQAEELVGCMGWSLTDEEVSMLEAASDLCK